MPNPCQLIRFLPFPPGGFPYEQWVNGKQYQFPDLGLDIQNQAQQIANFRKANGFPNSDLATTLNDLNIYTCQRLGCDPRFCSDGSTPSASYIQPPVKGCGTCGAKV